MKELNWCLSLFLFWLWSYMCWNHSFPPTLHIPLNEATPHWICWPRQKLPKPATEHACSLRVRDCSACSCGNSALFPYGGQECMHVSPHPSGKRWNRPQRSRIRDRERARFPPHPSLFMQGLPSHPGPDLHTTSYTTIFMDCSSPSANNSDGIRERTGRN